MRVNPVSPRPLPLASARRAAEAPPARRPDPAPAAPEPAPSTLALPEDPARYTVQSGDSLWRIAERQLGDGSRWHEIQALNQDSVPDADRILPGQVLKMPGAPAPAAPAPTPAAPAVPPAATTSERPKPASPAAPAARPARPAPGALDAGARTAGEAVRQARQAHPGRGAAELLGDPAVKAASGRLIQEMNRTTAAGDVTAANAAREAMLDASGLAGGDRQALAAAFSLERARQARQGAASPAEPGVNNGKNPSWYGHFAKVGMESDMGDQAAERRTLGGVENNFKDRLDDMLAHGYRDVRLEIDASQMPHPTVARAYDLFKGHGDYPYGRTPADFARAAADPSPAYAAALERAGVDRGRLHQELDRALALEDPAQPKGALLNPDDPRQLRNQEQLPRQLAYYDIAGEQLSAIADARRTHPDLAAHLVSDLGDFNRDLGDAAPFTPPAPGTPGARYVADTVARTRLLAAGAARAGVTSIELGNEPNLSPDGDDAFWTPDADNPRSITNAARRYADLSGTVYRALKADPATRDLGVDAASMAFTNPVGAPVDLEGLTRDKARAAMPAASDAQLDRFMALADEAGRFDAAGQGAQAMGAVDAMWNLHDQVSGVGEVSHHNDAIGFLETMHQAQQEFGLIRDGQTLLTDQTNIHLYGTPQANEELIGQYGRLAREGLIPRSAVVSEYGSRRAGANAKAADLYDQYANTVLQLEGAGLSPTSLQMFTYYPYDGWGVSGQGDRTSPEYNPYLASNRLGTSRR